MSAGSRRARRSVALAVVLPVLAVAGAVAGGRPALAQQAGDVQWAQTILKEKGFDIGGRANGQMTPQTRAALSAYQKSAGLPVTGQLDQTTVNKMMGDRQTKAVPTMGNLAQQRPGGGGPGQAPREPQREVVPRAVPTTKIESSGGDVVGGAQFSSSFPSQGAGSGSRPAAVEHIAPSTSSHSTPSHSTPSRSTAGTASPPAHPAAPAVASSASSSASSSSGAQGPAVQAAPRASVTASTPSGEPAPLAEPAAGNGSLLPAWLTGALRYIVMGVIGLTVGGIGFAWWRSGRASAPAGRAPRDDAPRDVRREPSFGTSRREELTTGSLPPLTSGGRVRR